MLFSSTHTNKINFCEIYSDLENLGYHRKFVKPEAKHDLFIQFLKGLKSLYKICSFLKRKIHIKGMQI